MPNVALPDEIQQRRVESLSQEIAFDIKEPRQRLEFPTPPQFLPRLLVKLCEEGRSVLLLRRHVQLEGRITYQEDQQAS